MVHHGNVARVRPRVGERGVASRRPCGRDGERSRHARRPGAGARERVAAHGARRDRPRRRVRLGAPRARALRAPRRRRQQRRLRPVRDGGGDQRAGGSRSDRDQPVRGAVGDPGGVAAPARAGRWPHRAGLVDRRHLSVRGHRDVSRLEVGAGGAQPGARAGGQGLRHPRDAGRAGRVLHGLGRVVGAQRPAAGRLRGGTRGVAAAPSAGRERGRRSDRLRAGHHARGRRRPAPVARLLRPRPAGHRRAGLRRPGGDLARVAAGRRDRAGRPTRAQ